MNQEQFGLLGATQAPLQAEVAKITGRRSSEIEGNLATFTEVLPETVW